jgi:hypothetical protein
MDAVKFLMERNRMLTSGFETPIIGGTLECEERAEQIVRTVERWSEEHPRKTRQSVFLERWPAAKLDKRGVLAILPCLMNPIQYRTPEGTCATGMMCMDCRKKYWGQEVE